MCNEIVLDRVNFSLTLTFRSVVQFKTLSLRFYTVNPAIPPTFLHLEKGTILNLENMSHAFAWIMVISLTLPPFNATLSSEVTQHLIWWVGMRKYVIMVEKPIPQNPLSMSILSQTSLHMLYWNQSYCFT